MLLTLALSQGIPMLSAGVEVGHSQNGNNNAYCQDNEISWIDWCKEVELPEKHTLFVFIEKVFAIRKRLSFYQHDRFIHDNDPRFKLQWLNSQAKPMDEADWQARENHCLGYFITDINENCALLVLFNANADDTLFSLPRLPDNGSWQQSLDTHANKECPVVFPSGCRVMLKAHSSWLLLSTKQECYNEQES